MSQPLPFYVVNAFTTKPFGGNPAAIVFVDNLDDADLLQKIAVNFHQPMTAFLRAVPTDDVDAKTATFDVLGMIQLSTETIHYRTRGGLVLIARKDGDWVDLTLAAANIQPASAIEIRRLSDVVGRAFGKEVSVRFAGVGLGSFSEYLLVEIDAEDDLAGVQPQHDIFLETKHRINIITSSSSDPQLAFVTRMFAPAMKLPEDPACGSANCLLAPYWAQKLGTVETEMLAKQVSTRGGDVKVKWHKSEGLMTMSGQVKVLMKGELFI